MAIVCLGFLASCGGSYCAVAAVSGPGSCPEGTACGSDGSCAPIRVGEREGAYAPLRDWALTRSDRPSEVIAADDRIVVGDAAGRTLYLSFGFDDTDIREIQSATLLFRTPSDWPPPLGSSEVSISAVSDFNGSRVTHQARPQAGTPAVTRTWQPGAAGVVRLDVTPVVARALRAGRQKVSMQIRVREGPITWEGPRAALEAHRPQLFLVRR